MIKLLKENIEQLLLYIKHFLPLANVHMVDYFTKNVYQTYVPLKIQNEINQMGYENVMNKIFINDFIDLPNLKEYAKQSKDFTLKNLEICLSIDQLQSKLSCSDILKLKLNIFMTNKKSHEVEILSYVAAAIKNISGTTHLVDIGDGKGYLSSMLALHHKIPVLGIDASEINTNGAVKRVKKLSRVWNSEVSKIIKNESNKTSVDKYKQITKYVDETINFEELISNIFLESSNGIGLVGLHTCGNLSTTCLKIFATDNSIKTICNVGCCYHFLGEAFEKDDLDIIGFPMSNFLTIKNIKIGRAARMIAAQSMERILEKKETPNQIIFYRALFEILLEKRFKNLPPEKRQVGRFRKKADNFVDYTRKALKRLNLELNISDSEIENLLNDYKDREYELYVFFLIRNMLSPIIESLILMDRLLYLLELGFENSYIVQLFDPIVSPRCYGLLAIK